jgi:hypothetical protein
MPYLPVPPAGSAAALVQYYLYGTGGTVQSVLQSTMGLDVDASLATANATLLDIQARRMLVNQDLFPYVVQSAVPGSMPYCQPMKACVM